jgi:hypothetical protein
MSTTVDTAVSLSALELGYPELIQEGEMMDDEHACRARQVMQNHFRGVELAMSDAMTFYTADVVRHGGVWWLVAGDPVCLVIAIQRCPWCGVRLLEGWTCAALPTTSCGP